MNEVGFYVLLNKQYLNVMGTPPTPALSQEKGDRLQYDMILVAKTINLLKKVYTWLLYVFCFVLKLINLDRPCMLHDNHLHWVLKYAQNKTKNNA